MSIMRGDKVVLVKEHEKMKMVGATLEVGNVTETAVVLRNPVTKVAVAAVGIDEFETYFAPEIQGWTPWTELIVMGGQIIGFYRTNGRKVQVKLHNGVRAEANCNKTDAFNLYIGVNIAINRCHKKMLTQAIADTQEQLAAMKADAGQIDATINELMKQAKPVDGGAKSEPIQSEGQAE